MKIFAVLGASAVAAFGQSVVVTVAATSPTQAVLTYTAPGNSACTVEISESITYAPLVHDADPSLFAGANLDNRAGSVNSAGNVRIFVAGTRAIQKAADSNNYSRALQQGTQHYFRVTCGSAVGTGTFMTNVLPMGTTFSDLIPLDANGNYLFPSVTQTRGAKLIDPQTGVLLTLVNVPSDNTTNSAPWPSAGGFGRYANDLVDAQGNYHVLFNDSPGGIFPSLYSINPTTGAANYLGAGYFYNETIAPDATGGITGVAGGTDTVMFDATDPNTVYVGVSINTTPTRSTIAKWTYTGNDNPLPGFAAAPATVVDLLGGQDLTTLAHAFNPALNTSEWGCGVVELQSHYFLLRCTGIGGVVQNVYAWEGAYDMGNGLPLGSGGNGHIVAMVPAWTLPGSRWCGDHSSEYLGNVPVMSFSVHSLTGIANPPYNHGGPYTSTLVGNIGSGDTTITITSTYPSGIGSPPAGYATGEPVSPNPDYFLMSAAVGDTFWIDSETFQITAKNSPTSWTVARGVGTTPATSHSSGATVLMACQNALTLQNSTGGYVWWDFVNNPTGTNPSQWVMNFGDHVVSRGNYRVDSGYSYRPGAVTNESTWGVNPAFYVTAHPIFSNSSAPADGNSYQKHPAMASGVATTFFDQTYFVGTTLFAAANSTATTKMAGSLYQYHYETGAAYENGTFLTPKYFPTLTKTAGHAFVDVSGPGSVLTGNPVDNYKYCIANAVNECVAGSAVGNVYFNHPSLSPVHPWCTGGEDGTGEQDICIGNFAPNGLASIQFGIANDHIGNLTYRPLTRLFETYEGMVSDPLKLTYGGEFAFMFQGTNTNPPAYTDNVWEIHVPPVPPSDGINRGTFVPAGLALTAPTGMGVATARVKFWYAEQGGSLSTPYCTSRREACVTTASTINQANPFSYATTEPYVPAPCAVSCTITIPVYPLHTAYYSAEFLNSSGNVVSTTQGIAMENAVVAGPPIAAAPPALSVTSLVCNPASLGPNAVSTCTVTLTQTAPIGGSSVTLASNNVLLTIPASVLMAAGATTVTFTATAAASITSNQSATVTATLGSSSTTATVSLSAPVLVSTLACNPASLGQSAVSTCTVTLTQAAPTGGSSVTLASNNVLLIVQPSVLVAAGATTAIFGATAAASITSNQSATVTAALGNSRTAMINLVAASGNGGGGGSGASGGTLSVAPVTITLNAPANGPASGGQTVTLTYQSDFLGGPEFQTIVTTSDGIDGTWLTVFPSSGTMTAVPGTSIPHTATATLTIKADSTGLSPGSVHTGTITYIAGQVTSSTSVTMNVANAVSANFTVAPQSLSFSFMQESSRLPAVQSVSVFTQPAGATFTASSNGDWLAIGAASSTTSLSAAGTTPGSVPVSVNVANLSPGTYKGSVMISSGTTTIDVPVTIAVAAAAPPSLSVSAATESFWLAQGSGAASGQATISNVGGGTLQFSAQATSSQGTWLTLNGSGSGDATPSAPVSLGFTADATGLAPGFYAGKITVQDVNSTAIAVVNVTLAVSQANQSLTISRSGLANSVIAGGRMPPSQSFTVTSQGSGSLNWTAHPQTISNPLAPSANWLSIAPASGLSVGGQMGSPIEVSMNPFNLPPGKYYGSVNIDPTNAANNPQSVMVLLNVTEAGGAASTNVGLSTGGVILAGPAGSSTIQQQQISLFNPSSDTLNYSAAVATTDGVGWLSMSPAIGQVLPGSASVSIAANLSALSPGVQTGTITIAFDNGTVGVIQVTVIATSPTSGSSSSH